MRLGRGASFVIATLMAVRVSAAEDPLDLRLTEPLAQVEIAAGSTVSIAWEAAKLPPEVEEWEAFLSIDAGRSYPIRLTPHLDASIHRFAWSVPNLPGAKVTILLRFGDERHERRFVFPARARISGVASPLAFLFRPPLIEAPGRGEAAEVEGEGVIAWVEGTRDGSSLCEFLAADALHFNRHGFQVPPQDECAATLGGPCGRQNSIGHPDSFCHAGLGRSDQAQVFNSADSVADILLTSRRRNI
ncbi:MAG: hypothetical protein M3041_12375 [Acidobacteriota bacterium]|nr:hypothetical protein [Acidobacteriota bacterium]